MKQRIGRFLLALKLMCSALALMPAVYLLVCLSVFVVFGVNWLPGYDGLRWFVLLVMAVIGVGACVGIHEEWKVTR